jgi:hypothetical protein
MTKGTSKSMVGTKNHDLADLVGKKIKSIVMREIDINGDGVNVRQFYDILCTDTERFILAPDGNSESQYATATLMDPDEFEDFLENVEGNQTDEPAELGEEDTEDEDDLDDEPEGFEDIFENEWDDEDND